MPAPSKRQKQTNLTVREPSLLMDFLARHFAGMSRTSLKGLLRNGQVCVNSKIETKFDSQLKKGDAVQINTGKVSYELKNTRLNLLYEDDYVIVVDKSEGLLSVSASPTKEGPSAFSIILQYLEKKNVGAKLYAVHRLDKATSGVMMFAKTVEAQHIMRDNWKQMVTERTYMAITEGIPEPQEDTIESYLHESRAQVMYSGGKNDGKLSVTHYRVVRTAGDYALLKLNLQTGRKNQIRVHMSDIGCPIIGDSKYGATSSPIHRLALHAKVLEFIHPITHEKHRFETPVPKEFNALLINEEKRMKELSRQKEERREQKRASRAGNEAKRAFDKKKRR